MILKIYSYLKDFIKCKKRKNIKIETVLTGFDKYIIQ